MQQLILKICCNEWKNASRDKRELSVCQALGLKVAVMAKGKPGDNFMKEGVDGFTVYRFSTRPLGTARFLNGINRVLSVLTWAYSARHFQADIISGHDLSGLFIGYLSNLFKCKAKRASLVYDSHEFEIERNVKRGKLTKCYITHLERFLMKRCAFSIMVNDSIADEVQKIHGLAERPVVVRNIPPFWNTDDKTGLAVRKQICSSLKISEDTMIVMYHGAIMPHRGIENILRAVALVPGAAATVLGNGEPSYLEKLHDLTDKMGIAERVWFHDAVSIEKLPHYVCAADVEMIILEPVVKNHYYTLPNKFFESIQGEVPVIVSDFPEVGRLTGQYGIGYKVNPEDVKEIAEKLTLMKTDKEKYAEFKVNLCIAKKELCWENEKQKLFSAYGNLVND